MQSVLIDETRRLWVCICIPKRVFDPFFSFSIALYQNGICPIDYEDDSRNREEWKIMENNILKSN